MPITLATGAESVQIPDHGSLIWTDERGWQDVVQSVTYCFGTAAMGAPAVIQESNRQLGGQPMTLTGGERWAWCRQATLDALIALLAPAGAQATVTLDDARQYTVTARRSDGPAVQSRPLARVADSPLVEADADTLHILEAVRLLIIAGPL